MDLEHIAQLLKEAKAKRQPRDDSGRFMEESVLDIAEKFRLDKKDLRVIALAHQEFKTPQEKKAAVFELGYQMQRLPTEADRAGEVYERISYATRQEQLQQEYLTRSRNLRGNQLITLKMEMRKKGLVNLH